VFKSGQGHPAQAARLGEVGIGGAHGIAIDALCFDAPAAPPLDRVIDGYDDRPLRHECLDE
jgi:hypothetical protein